ncbi:MAG: hypothetical protein N2491_05920 [Negativicutes bacterium]|nr:hypothetical protein [Negativicutes bacterium]
MTLLLDVLIMLWLLIGSALTLLPGMPGNLLIFLGIVSYGMMVNGGDILASTPVQISFVLMLIGELGGRLLRRYLTRGLPFTPAFSSNATVGSVGGMLASDALLGIAGILIWQLVVGKNLLPRLDAVSAALLRAMAATLLRFACGLGMIIIFFVWIV